MASRARTRSSATAAREFLLQSAELEDWTLDYVRKALGLDEAGARQALETLHALGYIEPVPGKRNRWRNTSAGNVVAGVSRAKPIKRSTIQKAIDESLDRANQVNQNPRFVDRVERLVLFGPFLTTNADRVKNADIAVELARKEKDPKRHQELADKQADEAVAAGKRFPTHVARRRYAEDEVRRFLKGRSRAIALRDVQDWAFAGPHKVLLGEAPDSRSAENTRR